ncbi:coiled-coil domain-containing protein [Pseudoclavibacter soli]|uniref:coiled-coil domain-containing protein n=1 Tax=Pseudoclavibacter soli TaxID=452623 RepID=UPI00040880E5|nr:hypothetical protein [Pseudoclavibacter soli]
MRVITGLALAASALLIGQCAGVAEPAAADTASDTQTQIDAINAQLDQLQQQANSLGDAAVSAAGAAAETQQQLESATASVAALSAQIASAETQVDTAREQTAAVVQQLVRGQSTQVGSTLQLVGVEDADGALWRMSTLAQVSDRTDDAVSRANAQYRELTALVEQQQQAEQERARLNEQAQSDAASAASASASAQSAVDQQQQRQSELIAQLAALKQTTIEQETREREQQQLAASYAESNDPGASTSTGATTGQSSSSGSGGSASTPSTVTPTTTAPTAPTTPSTPTTPTTPTTPSIDTSAAASKAYARGRLSSYGWGDDQYTCLVNLWTRESGWRYNASNSYSGAYGIPQALPGSKMASAGADWRTNPQTQINWGLGYIKARYGNPCGAWAHSESTGWY